MSNVLDDMVTDLVSTDGEATEGRVLCRVLRQITKMGVWRNVSHVDVSAANRMRGKEAGLVVWLCCHRLMAEKALMS